MIGYSERAVFSARSAEVYRAARALVSRVVSHLDREGREIRCHELARAVAKHLVRQGYELLVVDGVLGVCRSHLDRAVTNSRSSTSTRPVDCPSCNWSTTARS
jgi:site-specific recombinase XerD